jgi:hypothetical protein
MEKTRDGKWSTKSLPHDERTRTRFVMEILRELQATLPGSESVEFDEERHLVLVHRDGLVEGATAIAAFKAEQARLAAADWLDLSAHGCALRLVKASPSGLSYLLVSGPAGFKEDLRGLAGMEKIRDDGAAVTWTSRALPDDERRQDFVKYSLLRIKASLPRAVPCFFEPERHHVLVAKGATIVVLNAITDFEVARASEAKSSDSPAP